MHGPMAILNMSGLSGVCYLNFFYETFLSFPCSFFLMIACRYRGLNDPVNPPAYSPSGKGRLTTSFPFHFPEK